MAWLFGRGVQNEIVTPKAYARHARGRNNILKFVVIFSPLVF
jgi:hypothetical protein